MSMTNEQIEEWFDRIEKLDPDLQITLLRRRARLHPEFINHERCAKWCAKNGHRFVAYSEAREKERDDHYKRVRAAERAVIEAAVVYARTDRGRDPLEYGILKAASAFAADFEPDTPEGNAIAAAVQALDQTRREMDELCELNLRESDLEAFEAEYFKD